MKSRILRVNKLNTKSQKKNLLWGLSTILNMKSQKFPHFEFPQIFLTYNVLLWLGQGIIFSY